MLPSPFDKIAEISKTESSHLATQTIFRQDSKTRGMFFVKNGEIELQRHTENGDRVVIHRAYAGETFAEASLFSDVYHCDAVAQSQCEVIEFDRQAVLLLFEEDSKFAKALAARFAIQVQSYRRRLELLAIRSAKERVHAGKVDGLLGGDVMSFASEICLSHEATYRALSTLVTDGRIKKTGRGQYLAK